MYAFAPLQIYVTSRIAFFPVPFHAVPYIHPIQLSQVLACTAPRSPMVLWHRTFKFAHCTGKETRCQTRPHHPGAFLSETRSVGLGLGSVCSVFYPSIPLSPFSAFVPPASLSAHLSENVCPCTLHPTSSWAVAPCPTLALNCVLRLGASGGTLIHSNSTTEQIQH